MRRSSQTSSKCCTHWRAASAWTLPNSRLGASGRRPGQKELAGSGDRPQEALFLRRRHAEVGTPGELLDLRLGDAALESLLRLARPVAVIMAGPPGLCGARLDVARGAGDHEHVASAAKQPGRLLEDLDPFPGIGQHVEDEDHRDQVVPGGGGGLACPPEGRIRVVAVRAQARLAVPDDISATAAAVVED